MTIFGINNIKYIAMNEKKTAGVIFEYPSDISFSEILDRVSEFRNFIFKEFEMDLKKRSEEISKESVKEEVQKDSIPESN